MKFFNIASFTVLLMIFTASGNFVRGASTTTKENIKICFETPETWDTTSIYSYVYRMNGEKAVEIKAWPGNKMEKENSLYCTSFSWEYQDGFVIFSDKDHQIPDQNQQGFEVEPNAIYNSEGYKSSLSNTDPIDLSFKYYGDWNNAYLYLMPSDESGARAYGVSMDQCKEEADCKFIRAIIPNTIPEVKICLSNENYEYICPGTHISKSGDYKIVDGVLSEY